MRSADGADVLVKGLQLQQLRLTFQLADLRLTVRPLVVTVHFILMKKSRSVLSSLPFLPKPPPGTHKVTGMHITMQSNEHVPHIFFKVLIIPKELKMFCF